MKEQSKQVPIQKLEVYIESVAMENWASSADRSHALFVVIGKIGVIIRRQCVDLLPGNKYQTRQSVFVWAKDCICWESHCIEHRTYKMFNEIVFYQLVCHLSVLCLVLKLFLKCCHPESWLVKDRIGWRMHDGNIKVNFYPIL